MLIVESLLQAGDISIRWQRRGDHLAKPVIGVGVKRGKTCYFANSLLGIPRQSVACIPHFIPIVFFLKFDRGRHG